MDETYSRHKTSASDKVASDLQGSTLLNLFLA
jgi:hypothetical protein